MIQVTLSEVVSMMRGDEEAIPSEAAGQWRGEYMIRLVFKEFPGVNLFILSHPSTYLRLIMGALYFPVAGHYIS